MLTGFPILDRLLDSEPEQSRGYLEDVLAGGSLTAEYVSKVLTEAGHPVSASTIRTFRRSRRMAQV